MSIPLGERYLDQFAFFAAPLRSEEGEREKLPPGCAANPPQVKQGIGYRDRRIKGDLGVEIRDRFCLLALEAMSGGVHHRLEHRRRVIAAKVSDLLADFLASGPPPLHLFDGVLKDRADTVLLAMLEDVVDQRLPQLT